ncbi:hypothetical protein PoB_007662900 [Plakobranchus ocellatus]|uniref:Uncharacterized protein n=1 Tax=Plakobranchus ocellatus TaxID=259542 RepID=A0AAV4E0U6_9GAST|nr:hypothetical protein PoB_007662900 [Plakobranchus ocellatus]
MHASGSHFQAGQQCSSTWTNPRHVIRASRGNANNGNKARSNGKLCHKVSMRNKITSRPRHGAQQLHFDTKRLSATSSLAPGETLLAARLHATFKIVLTSGVVDKMDIGNLQKTRASVPGVLARRRQCTLLRQGRENWIVSAHRIRANAHALYQPEDAYTPVLKREP